MSKIPVIAIFDIGKTNKKVLLFDEHYKVVYEESRQFDEITDEDGFACEDLMVLTNWVKESFAQLQHHENFDIKAVNFSGYGASFVYLDDQLNVIAPLYNYLKPYSPDLQKQFYAAYGGESKLSKQTASPVLGNLNSGMQLYRMKYEQPALFAKIRYALHFPQYLSFILTGNVHTDITSIGCHTSLWNFSNQQYHEWVEEEGIDEKFAPILPCEEIAGYAGENIPVGVGLHDSSAALIPYLRFFHERFILLSTGTWCITLNPFNHSVLTDYELHHDCLSYLSFQGNAIKASRLFAGYEHEQQTKRLSAHFNKPLDYFKQVVCNPQWLKRQDQLKDYTKQDDGAMLHQSVFETRDLSGFDSYEKAYHQLIADIIVQQVFSTGLVLKGTEVKRIFVDGGFSKNPIFMNMLAELFPEMETFAATVAQASSLGAALVMHQHWNTRPLPSDIIDLKFYAGIHRK